MGGKIQFLPLVLSAMPTSSSPLSSFGMAGPGTEMKGNY